MDDGTHELNTNSRKELAEYIATIESLTEERIEVLEKIKAQYAEAASGGYDKKAIQQIIKERLADSEKSVTQRAITATYRRALGSLANTPLGDWARSWMAHEARINKPTTAEESPQMAEFLQGRKQKTNGDGDAAQA